MQIKLIISIWSGFQVASVISEIPHSVVFEWTQLDYAFSSDIERLDWIQSGKFIIAENTPSGVKRYGNRIFLAVPRWYTGVPSTLNQLHYNSSTTEAVRNAKLVPFPSWDMNVVGNCEGALQNTQSMEVDQYGRMWIIDSGRTKTHDTKSDNHCSPKLWLADLANNDKIIHRYQFPHNVVDHQRSILNDIAVGCLSRDDCWAYITDSGMARIVVYSLTHSRSWYVVNRKSMSVDPAANILITEGKPGIVGTPVDGVALSPADTLFSKLYYRPMSSFNLYQLNTSTIQSQVLRSRYGVHLHDRLVHNLGKSKSQADGMMMDADGILYYGQLALDAVYSWDTKLGTMTETNQHQLFQNTEIGRPVSFAIDENGDAFFTAFNHRQVNPNISHVNEPSYYIVRIHVGAKSYAYSNKM